nr:hypothetical protein [Kaistia nematophila]
MEGPAEEPATVTEAAAQCGISLTASNRQSELERHISTAREFVELHCSVRLVTQTIEMSCDDFSDLTSLPVAPIQELLAIAYTDLDGSSVIVPADIYHVDADELSPMIGLSPGRQWPAKKPGSRIVTTAVAGYGSPERVPAQIRSAILLLVGLAASLAGRDALVRTETVEGVGSTQFGGVVEVSGSVERAVSALLSNYRRWPL